MLPLITIVSRQLYGVYKEKVGHAESSVFSTFIFYIFGVLALIQEEFELSRLALED